MPSKLNPGYYFVSISDKKMYYLDYKQDLSKNVKDFNLFKNLGCDIIGDLVYVLKDKILRYPLMNRNNYLKISDVMNFEMED